MTTKIPIATVSYLRRWQRQHRRLVGSTHRSRHDYLARTLALTGMTPAQTAIVTAHLAHIEQSFCCDAVAEAVAATLRPALFATVVLESLADGKPMIIGDSPSRDDIVEAEAVLNALADGKPMILGSDGSDGDEAEAVLNALADGKPMIPPSRKKRKP